MKSGFDINNLKGVLIGTGSFFIDSRHFDLSLNYYSKYSLTYELAENLEPIKSHYPVNQTPSAILQFTGGGATKITKQVTEL